MTDKKYLAIVQHLESCLEKYGDTHRGVDWPKAEDVDKRHNVMMGVIARNSPEPIELLDFGCGLSHFYEYLQRNNLLDGIRYTGLDISHKYIGISKRKFPANTYYCLDLLESGSTLPDFDYIVMNGVFTAKCTLSYEEMLWYFQSLVVKVFTKARIGLAFNVMSKHVDWEREDLFHLSLDVLASFLTKQVSRHFVIRHDYRLYEYTTYVYR